MCFFDSPIGRCEAVHEMVLLDETQAECAREHECPPGRQCPLDGCFTTMSGVAEEHIEALREQARHPELAASLHSARGESTRHTRARAA